MRNDLQGWDRCIIRHGSALKSVAGSRVARRCRVYRVIHNHICWNCVSTFKETLYHCGAIIKRSTVEVVLIKKACLQIRAAIWLSIFILKFILLCLFILFFFSHLCTSANKTTAVSLRLVLGARVFMCTHAYVYAHANSRRVHMCVIHSVHTLSFPSSRRPPLSLALGSAADRSGQESKVQVSCTGLMSHREAALPRCL